MLIIHQNFKIPPVINGTLKLKIVEATLTRDTELIGKMDPYCEILYNHKTYTTSVQDNAGQNPKWDYNLILNVFNNSNTITFAVYNSIYLKKLNSNLGTDDLIGSYRVSVKKLCENC